MRRVTIREFNRNMYHEMKDLPLIVTRSGKDILQVTKPGEKPNVMTKEVEVATNVTTSKCMYMGCERVGVPNICKGDEKGFACGNHILNPYKRLLGWEDL